MNNKRLHGVSILVVIGWLVLGAVAWAGQDERIPLSLSIAVPVRGKQGSIENAQFHVVVRNISTHTVNLWLERCSWGYFSLTFDVTDESGKSWIVKKKNRAWEKDYPGFCTVEPNGYLVIDVTLNPDTWENPPRPEAGKSRTVTMRAVFQIGETEESKKNEVWTGKVVSEAKQYTLW